jgi:hypothetical protein
MSGAETTPPFRGRTIIVLTLVGIVALAALAVLGAFAGEFRGGQDPRPHALSRTAIGYAGVPILMKAVGAPMVVSRTKTPNAADALLVLTADAGSRPEDLTAMPKAWRTLIVLPKWQTAPEPLRPGAVRKIGLLQDGKRWSDGRAPYAAGTLAQQGGGRTRPRLRGVGGPFAETDLALGPIDRLQTITGPGWTPLLLDAQGRSVLAASTKRPDVWVLADPDLLNNQGLADIGNARGGAAILEAARAGRPILFDVTLAGYARERGIGRTLLTPPWLAATLCALAAAVLMGLHALANFGPVRRGGRAFAPGPAALVENSAGLVRMARKEGEFAPAYADLVRTRIAINLGAHTDAAWLEELARRRGATPPSELAAEAAAAKSRHDVLSVGRKLFHWRSEMTRDHR